MNNPKFIYSSSPDRGLDTLLNLWLQIRKEFPDAELHVYYGFGNWDKAISQRNNENEKRLRDQILENMKQPGIFYHGRVNQDELAKDFLFFYQFHHLSPLQFVPFAQVQIFLHL